MVSQAVYAKVLSYFEFWPSKDVAIVALSLYLAASLAVLAMTVKTRTWYTSFLCDSQPCAIVLRAWCKALRFSAVHRIVLITLSDQAHVSIVSATGARLANSVQPLAAQDNLQLTNSEEHCRNATSNSSNACSLLVCRYMMIAAITGLLEMGGFACRVDM